MHLVVIFEPSLDGGQDSMGIRQRLDPDIIALEGLTSASAMPLLSGLSIGVKQAMRLRAMAMVTVLAAA